jgi:hypothetical protein
MGLKHIRGIDPFKHEDKVLDVERVVKGRVHFLSGADLDLYCFSLLGGCDVQIIKKGIMGRNKGI